MWRLISLRYFFILAENWGNLVCLYYAIVIEINIDVYLNFRALIATGFQRPSPQRSGSLKNWNTGDVETGDKYLFDIKTRLGEALEVCLPNQVLFQPI